MTDGQTRCFLCTYQVNKHFHFFCRPTLTDNVMPVWWQSAAAFLSSFFSFLSFWRVSFIRLLWSYESSGSFSSDRLCEEELRSGWGPYWVANMVGKTSYKARWCYHSIFFHFTCNPRCVHIFLCFAAMYYPCKSYTTSVTSCLITCLGSSFKWKN